jgi:c-di-GMP-binding flagellar brake protein YcgR
MDRRHDNRPNLMTYLEVRCAETGRPVGRIVDLTTSGMRLITANELSLDQEFQLVIPLDNGPGAPEELRIDARCMWVGHDVNPDLSCAGFEFQHVRPRQQALLARLIHDHRFTHQSS